MRFPVLVATAAAALTFASRAVRGADFAVTNVNADGPGSFAQAITDANANPGADRIVFNIPGPGVQKIDVSQNALPEITDPITIDGYTQPGASPNTLAIGDNAVVLIQIDGVLSYSTTHGLTISAGNSTVRGLSVVGFDLATEPSGIILRGQGGNVVAGNFIGVYPDGSKGIPDSSPNYTSNQNGILVQCDHNVIGGTDAASRNVIGGNENGILLNTPETSEFASTNADLTSNEILGNYIGVTIDGTTGVQNGVGVLLGRGEFTGTIVGGTGPGAGNVISGNLYGLDSAYYAMSPYGPPLPYVADDFAIEGNLIGTTADGVGALGNLYVGVSLRGKNIAVGGLDPAAGNVIGFNGVGIIPAVVPYGQSLPSDPILSNLIYANTTGAIGADETGAVSYFVTYPIVTSVTAPAADGSRTVSGGLRSEPETDFIIQVFHYAPEPDSKPTIVNTFTVHSDALGLADFQFSYSAGDETGAPDEYFGATATDAGGNTSALSPSHGLVALANLSTRGVAGNGDNLLIAGFVIRGPNQKHLLLRALGPSLPLADESLGLRLADPLLEVYDSGGALIAQNDNWRLNSSDDVTNLTYDQLAPPSDFESALYVDLPPGSYTAHVRGASGGTGIAVVEIYDANPIETYSGRLVNLSTRGQVGTGDNVLIGGFIAAGQTFNRLLIRAIGPDLNVPGSLQDPTLELRDASGNLVGSNDNWRDTQEQEITDTTIAPNADLDAAILANLIPGNYTAIVRGQGDNTGIALVEFYDLQN